MTSFPESDLSGTISRLFVYPVKSCAGVEVQEALLTETGLDLDRAWMVVDAQGVFLTQRALPRMALIRPQIKTSELVLRAPGMLALHLAVDAVEGRPPSRYGRTPCLPGTWAPWLRNGSAIFWGNPAVWCGLARTTRRLSSTDWTQGVEALNQFSDGFPLLVVSEASLAELNARLVAAGQEPVGMERFRPNVVLAGGRRTTKTAWTWCAWRWGSKRCTCSPSSLARAAPFPTSIRPPHTAARWWRTPCRPIGRTRV